MGVGGGIRVGLVSVGLVVDHNFGWAGLLISLSVVGCLPLVSVGVLVVPRICLVVVGVVGG